ncbi:MAG: FecR family protein [Proteobacteria bacterium]|nr:FecR family protein [Pseudomonadota bacterium]
MSDRVEDPLIVEALRWLVLLRDDQTADGDREAFERWRRSDAAHEAAWQRAQAVWARTDILKPAFARPGTVATLPLPDRSQPTAGMTRRRWLQAAAVAAVAAPAGYVASRSDLWADYRTSAGERRTLSLADGSTVELAGASALSVSFARDARRAELVTGEAFFSVAADPSRPFTVDAGGGRTRALGTAFNIKLAEDFATVTVAEHRVEVSTAGGTVELEQGQQVRYAGPRLEAPRSVDLRAVQGWRRDRLVFQDAPLGEVIADLERCRGGRIVLTDSRLRALPVTGVFDARQVDGALTTIASILPIKLHRLTDWLVVMSPA